MAYLNPGGCGVICWKHLLLFAVVSSLFLVLTSTQECSLDLTQGLESLLADTAGYRTAENGVLYLSGSSQSRSVCSGNVTTLSVVFKRGRGSKAPILNELQIAVYSVGYAGTFRRVSDVVTVESMHRPFVIAGGKIAIATVNLEPRHQLEILEGQTLGIQANGDSSSTVGSPWLIGDLDNCLAFASPSSDIRNELVMESDGIEANFPGISFFVEADNATQMSPSGPISPNCTHSEMPVTVSDIDTMLQQNTSTMPPRQPQQPVILYVLPAIFVIFLILTSLILVIIVWTFCSKRKLSSQIPNESVENPVSEVVLSMSDDIGTSAEYEVESRDKGRERGSSPTDVDPDVGYAPYDSCYMCTYMYTDDLELSGQEPLPYEVPIARQGIRSSKRSVHFVHMDTHPSVALRTGNVIYENLHPFQPPPGDVKQLRNTLAQRKCAEIPRSALRRGNLIGKGEFGAVYKGVWESHTRLNPEVALKMLRGNANKQDKVKFLQEAAIMGQFNHPHIVKLFGAITVGDPMMLILELLDEGDLLQWLENHSKKNELDVADLPKQLLYYCQDVADGMKYLANKGFIHRDLAARNILLDKNLRCKIADFGLARDLYGSTYYASSAAKVPVRWSPPEVLSQRRYSLRSDVWSFGMVMFEIWSLGKMPFSDIPSLKTVIKTVVKRKGFLQAPPPGCPRAVYKLMVHCWNYNDMDRISFNDVSIHLSFGKDTMLIVSQEDSARCKSPHKASCLGAPLTASNDLYQDLQNYYVIP